MHAQPSFSECWLARPCAGSTKGAQPVPVTVTSAHTYTSHHSCEHEVCIGLRTSEAGRVHMTGARRTVPVATTVIQQTISAQRTWRLQFAICTGLDQAASMWSPDDHVDSLQRMNLLSHCWACAKVIVRWAAVLPRARSGLRMEGTARLLDLAGPVETVKLVVRGNLLL